MAPAGTPRGQVPAPATSIASLAPNWSSWESWWRYNKAAYIDLESRARALPQTPGGLVNAWSGKIDPRSYRSDVIQAAQELLSEADDYRVVRSSLITMARATRADHALAREYGVHGAIADQLDNPRQVVAETAVLALGVSGSLRDSQLLGALLADSKAGRAALRATRVPIRLRALAAYAMGLACEHNPSEVQALHAVHQLGTILKGKDARYPDLQVACVLGLGMVELPELGDETSRGLEHHIDSLIALLEDKNEYKDVRTHAPTAIARLVMNAPAELRERAAAVLVKHCSRSTQREKAIRHSAIAALGLIGDADQDKIDVQIRRALEGALRDGQSIERNFAALALAQVGGRVDPENEDSLRNSRAVTKTLSNLMTRGKSRQKPWAGLALGVQGRELLRAGSSLPSNTMSSLAMRIQETRSAQDSAAYSIAAGLARSTKAQAHVEEDLLHTHDQWLRGELALSLGMMGAVSSRNLLKDEMDDAWHKPKIMEQAALARHLLGDGSLVPHLLSLLKECDCWLSTTGVTRALGWTADGRAVAPLLKIARDQERSDSERSAAVTALGRLMDETPLPLDRQLGHGVNYVAAPFTLTDPTGLGVLDVL